MAKEEWKSQSLEEIIEEFDRKHGKIDVSLYWEGWRKITAEDLKDYQGRY